MPCISPAGAFPSPSPVGMCPYCTPRASWLLRRIPVGVSLSGVTLAISFGSLMGELWALLLHSFMLGAAPQLTGSQDMGFVLEMWGPPAELGASPWSRSSRTDMPERGAETLSGS